MLYMMPVRLMLKLASCSASVFTHLGALPSSLLSLRFRALRLNIVSKWVRHRRLISRVDRQGFVFWLTLLGCFITWSKARVLQMMHIAIAAANGRGRWDIWVVAIAAPLFSTTWLLPFLIASTIVFLFSQLSTVVLVAEPSGAFIFSKRLKKFSDRFFIFHRLSWHLAVG